MRVYYYCPNDIPPDTIHYKDPDTIAGENFLKQKDFKFVKISREEVALLIATGSTMCLYCAGKLK